MHRIDDFVEGGAGLDGWLFGIARKLGGNLHRRSARRNTRATDLDDLVEHPAVAGPETTYAAHDWVLRALDTLPQREREVVACREVVGLDVDATAVALGLKPGAVRVAHHRGLRRLRTAGIAGPAEARPDGAAATAEPLAVSPTGAASAARRGRPRPAWSSAASAGRRTR
jgi:RNA polymerase sigma-70 factor (ECF subfamily)